MDYSDLLKRFTDQGVKEQSAKVYITNFKHVMNYLYGNAEFYRDFTMNNYISDLKFFDKLNAMRILEFIDKPEITLNTKDNLLRGFLKCLDALEIDTTVYLESFQPILTDLKYDKEFIEANPKEEKNKLSQDELVELREEYKAKLTDKFTKNDLYFVLLSLYTYVVPLRGEDWYNTLLVDESTDHKKFKINHLDLEEKKMYLYNYKTARTYGTRILDIPNELCEILKTFKDKSKSHYVICSPKGQKILQPNFCRLFKEATGKEFSSSMARKCFISEGIDNKKSIEERKKDARIMAHCTATATVHYSKFSKLLHNEDDSLEGLIEQRKLLNKLQKDLDKKILNKLKLIE